MDYRLDVSIELEYAHNVFLVFQQRKYVLDPSHTIMMSPINEFSKMGGREQKLWLKIKNPTDLKSWL